MCQNLPPSLIFWLLAISIAVVNGIQIRFYRSHDYTGLIQESTSTEKCINLPGNHEISSYTTDTCFIIYEYANCQSAKNWKFIPGNYSTGNSSHYTFKSFHVCNDEEGGSQLNIDITNYTEQDNLDVPVALERYTRVCTCINIPDYVKKMNKWSMNNHNNNFVVYYEPDCAENILLGSNFPAGRYDDIRNIYNWPGTTSNTNTQYKIQSFGPDENSSYFKSSCQTNILLSQLTRKLQLLEENLQRNDLKVITNQRDIHSLQNEFRDEETKLEEKFRAVSSKIEDVEKTMEDKIEKLKDELQFISGTQNN